MQLSDKALAIAWNRITGKPNDAEYPIKGFFIHDTVELVIVFKRKLVNGKKANDALFISDDELTDLIEKVPELKSEIVLAAMGG